MCSRAPRNFDIAPVHKAFINYGRRARDYNIVVGRYVMMPDHIHFFVQGDLNFDLGLWIRGLKRVVADTVLGGRKQLNISSSQRSLWRRGFFDHLIRNTESCARKWDYIRENPVRAGLVTKSEDWIFQGEIGLIDRT